MWTKKWWKQAGERALRTFAQAALAMIGTGATPLLSVDWATILSVSAMASVVSVLTSIVCGIPEFDREDGGV